LPTCGATHARRRAGLCRPAARRQLAAQLLKLCEMRLRLEAFAAHHAAAAAEAATVGEGDDVLCAFVAAVRQIMRMHAAAVQALHREAAPAGSAHVASGGDAGTQDAAAARDSMNPRRGLGQLKTAPRLTLLDLVVSLENLGAQLRDLCRLCRCTPAPEGAPPRGAPAGGGGSAAQWPAELAGVAEESGWGPSAWQLLGFVSGPQLLDGLYRGELNVCVSCVCSLPSPLTGVWVEQPVGEATSMCGGGEGERTPPAFSPQRCALPNTSTSASAYCARNTSL
jgi:hypothetical protein